MKILFYLFIIFVTEHRHSIFTCLP